MRFVKTSTLLQEIEIDEDFLYQERGKLFIAGIHFAIPKGKKYALWNLEEMFKWAGTHAPTTDEELANDVVQSMLAS